MNKKKFPPSSDFAEPLQSEHFSSLQNLRFLLSHNISSPTISLTSLPHTITLYHLSSSPHLSSKAFVKVAKAFFSFSIPEVLLFARCLTPSYIVYLVSHLAFSFTLTISTGLLSIPPRDHHLPLNHTFRASDDLCFNLAFVHV